MRTSILRGFIPTAGATVYNEGGTSFRLAGRDPVFEVAGCSETLTLDFRGQTLAVSVTPIQRGQTVVLKRPGQPDVAMTAKQDGILLDVPIPARPEMLRALRGRPIQLDVDFAVEDWASLERATAATAHVAGLRLAAAGEKGDCELMLVD